MKKILLGIIGFFVPIFFIQGQTLYGGTFQGGSDGGGTINKFQPVTNNLIVAKSFESIASNPVSTFIQATDGKLYSMTAFGGRSGLGIIFSYDPSSGNYKKLKDFDNISGAVPDGSLMQASNGKLYGMTAFGGSNNVGVMFSYDPVSATYTKLIDFSNTNGGNPFGSLIQATDGKLYGMTSGGGSNGGGVIFSYDVASSTYNKVMDFDFTNGGDPMGSLLEAKDRKLYGMTYSGGKNGFGVIFSFNPAAKNYAKLRDFDLASGYNASGSLIQANDGKLYGMTGGGGNNDDGVIFSFNPSTKSYNELKDFDGTNGRFPGGSLYQANDGKLYGMSVEGGSSNVGVFFSLDPHSNTFTKLTDFDYNNGALPRGNIMQANNGRLYAMTSQGGGSGDGIIFSFDLANSAYTMLKDFGTNESGTSVSASLIKANDGKLYGMTAFGGTSGFGVIFSFDPSSSTYRKLKDFDNANGAIPLGCLVQARDGKLYGMTGEGGSGGYGVIFSYDPSSSTYSKLRDFDYTNGANPDGGLIQASDGKLYGMTQFGGSNGVGVAFSFDPSSSHYTKLVDFDFNTNGGYPTGSFLQANNGKLYATTPYGGSSQQGVLFSYDIRRSSYTKLVDFDYTNAGEPEGKLLQANDGKLYGMTFTSQTGSGPGVIFSYDPSSSVYTKLKDFDNADGANPLGSLIQASDGKLYGMTEQGGSSNLGVIFSFDPLTSAYTKLQDYNGANGAFPYLGAAFIEVPLNSTIVRTSNKQSVSEEQEIATEFILKSSPNPSSSQFTLKIESANSKEILNLRVVDILGNVIEVKNNIVAGQTLQIGNNYRPGVYFLELTQGNNKKQLKLIKM